MTGKFITIDGIDGAGKTTQIDLLRAYLSQRGKTVYITREPGGTALSEKIRDLLLSQDNCMQPLTELLLMFAARADHINRVLRPRVLAGQWVICSRFTDATIAYQGYARGLDLGVIAQLADWVHGDFNPDISFFLDLSVEAAAKRRVARGHSADRFEVEKTAFMQAVRDGYLRLAKSDPGRCRLIDASRSIAAVSSQIIKAIAL